jgi:hypothetical protein
MIDLNKEVLKCPHCRGMPVAFPVESIQKGDRIEEKVRCYDCGQEYWVTWDVTKRHVLTAEEEVALWRGSH